MSQVWASILAALKAIWPDILAALKLIGAGWTGAKLQQGREATDALQDVERAAKAAARVDLLSPGDVVRELEERELYRLPPEQANGE